jgi:hypothetical protein
MTSARLPWLASLLQVVVVLAGGLGGCVRPQAPEPAESSQLPRAPTASDGVCARHVAHLRDEQCGDEPDNECTIAEFPCEHWLDFDGDGAADHVELSVHAGGGIGLRVVFGAGHEVVLDAPLALSELGEPDDVGRTLDPDLSWLMGWMPAPRGPTGLQVGGRTFEILGASGDGLWLTGGDAAAILVLGPDGWRVIELGY